ncbi:hypothetical protein [Rhizobium setariae]|nr:hypothetical protein [Rhizobium setariae]
MTVVTIAMKRMEFYRVENEGAEMVYLADFLSKDKPNAIRNI